MVWWKFHVAVDVVSEDEEVLGGVVVEEELDCVIEFDVCGHFNKMI